MCARQGTEEVYVDFLCKIAGLVKSLGKRMQFWGDIVLKCFFLLQLTFSKPEVITRLPKDVICLIWGYEVLHNQELTRREIIHLLLSVQNLQN